MEAILLRQIFDLNMLSKRFALSFQFSDLVSAFFSGLLELTLLLLIGFDFFGLHLLGELDFGEFNQFTAEQSVLATDLGVELAPGRVDDPGCIRNRFGSVLDQSV